ncbi:MAG: xanthine dehydrogenase family protein subunit M, partial [Actinomycetota bacterium]
RRAQDWAIVGAAVMLGTDPKVALVNMGSAPIRHGGVETALAGGGGADAASVAGDDVDPPEDLNADAEYRRHLARVLVGRGIAEASA